MVKWIKKVEERLEKVALNVQTSIKRSFEVVKQSQSCRCFIDVLVSCLQKHSYIEILLSWQITKKKKQDIDTCAHWGTCAGKSAQSIT